MNVKLIESISSAIYKFPGTEKIVSEQFFQAVTENYLALSKVKNHLSDRIKEVMVPVRTGLILGYIPLVDFVKVTVLCRGVVFKTRGKISIKIQCNQINTLQFTVDTI